MDSRPIQGSPVVVIIDDDAAVLHALEFALETQGFDVRPFRRAVLALSAPDVGAAACLVIDQCLPDVPGLELLARLRAQGIKTPAVMITTDPPPLLRSQAAALGAPIVEKPLLGDRLFSTIRELIAATA